MELTNPDADVFAPDGSDPRRALARTTHLAVGAHQDDIEFMALHGVLACFGRRDRWFTGVTITDGAGSPRTGAYADRTHDEMKQIRVSEQRKAAVVGDYSCQIQLLFSSAVVKDPSARDLPADLRKIFELATPDVVYLHNPADKHDTHVACCLRAVAALRALPTRLQPKRVYGCEVWRDLDWLADDDKQLLPVDDHANIAAALCGVFDSQITGGKRYDLAVQGRRMAHATFHQPDAVDRHRMLSLAMDLTPMIVDPSLDPGEFTAALVRRTEADVRARIARLSGQAGRRRPTNTKRSIDP